MLSFGSVCSGIGGLDRGLHRAGLGPVRWQCEAQPFRRRVLARHWPGVICHPDLTTLQADDLEPVDVLAAGTPCPDFSTANAIRRGLDGDHSRLFWDFARLRNALCPEWTIWENVDGALTSNQGLDFALVLGAFVGADVHAPRAGWARAGVAAGPWGGAVWRVLDAQHFGTPQRRRRVFVVARLGGPCPPEILLEPTRRGGDSAPRDQAAQDAARALGARVAGTLGLSRSQVIDGHGAYVAAGEPVVRALRKAQKAHHDQDAERWEPAAFNVATSEGGSLTAARPAEHAYALRAGNQTDDPGSVVVAIGGIRRPTAAVQEVGGSVGFRTQSAHGPHPHRLKGGWGSAVRRLTPT